MDKYSVFDQILDSVFVVDAQTTVCYANHSATELVGLSQKRLVGKKTLADLVSLELFPFPFTENSAGFLSPSSYLETALTSVDGRGRSCKVQLAVTPWHETEDGKPLWVFVLKDVSLEEALHSKYKSELEQKEGYIIELKKAHDHLEDLVEERTQQLKSANLTLKAIIDSLGQGFLTFNRGGQCGDIFTKACETILEANPSGKTIEEVLKITPEKSKEFKMWSNTVFEEMLPFDDMKALGPNEFDHSGQKSVFLEYFPIRDDKQKIAQVVVVATDKTNEVEAQKKLAEERAFVEMVLKYVKNKKQFIEFFKTIPVTLDGVLANPLNTPDLEKEAFRILHTLEGEAGTFSLDPIRLAAKDPQQILLMKKANWRELFKAAMVELRGRYATCLNQLEECFGAILQNENDAVEVSRKVLQGLAERLSTIPALQGEAQKIRELMTSETIHSALMHYEGLVKGLAEKLGKKVLPLKFEGASDSMDIVPIKPLLSSFVHILRNSLDHGIEPSEERSFVGKPEAGQISIICEKNEQILKIKISDDGKGINPKIIRKKLLEKFPERDFSSESDEAVIQNIFLPGFSSRDEIGEFSGRGIGMDAVREEVLRLGGQIWVKSSEGQGTEFLMEVPLQAWLNSKEAA